MRKNYSTNEILNAVEEILNKNNKKNKKTVKTESKKIIPFEAEKIILEAEKFIEKA